MQDELCSLLNSLSPEQTDALLQGFSAMPLPAASARRIRRRTLIRAGAKDPAGNRRLRYLAPVAAVALALTILLSIPSVSRAVSEWFASCFNLDRYFYAAPEEREPNPAVEQTIRTPAPGDQSYVIRYLDELDYYKGTNDWRIKNGFPAFDRKDYAWVGRLHPEISEVLYDGENLILRSKFDVPPGKFSNGFMPHQPDFEDYDLWCYDAYVTVNGETAECYPDSGLTLPWIYYDKEAAAYDLAAIRSARESFVQTRFESEITPAYPDGPVTVTLHHWVFDGKIDDMSPVGLIAIIEQTLTFDATEGNKLLQSGGGSAVRWQGTAPVTFCTYGPYELTLLNERMDLTKVSVTATVTKRPTGMRVQLHYDYPEAWNEHSEWGWYCFLEYDLYVNGDYVRRLGPGEANVAKPREDAVLEIPFTEAELSKAESVFLRPVMQYIEGYVLLPEEPGVYETEHLAREDCTIVPFGEVTLIKGNTWELLAETTLTGCDIPIPIR